MPLNLNVGLSKKMGEPNYGSRGASVNLELEVDTMLVNRPAELQDRIRQLFLLAQDSIEEQLARPPATSPPPESGNGPQRGEGPRPATESQARAIYAIARRTDLDLSGELHSRYRVDRPEELSLAQASEFIDAIKPANG